MNTIRWKSGMLLWAFLTALGFFTANPFGLYSELKGVFGISIIILAALLLAGIFVLSLYKSEKRIVVHQYTVWWLIKFNVLLIVILYAAGFLSSLALSRFWSEPGSGMFAGLVLYEIIRITPLLVFIFSVIPSLFFAKFYSNDKLFRALSFITIALFLAISSLNFYITVTCDNGRQYICLAAKASMAKDITICEKSKHWSYIDGCYLAVSQEWSDVTLCDKFSHESTFAFDAFVSYQSRFTSTVFEANKNRCLQNIAAYTKNPQICEQITIDGTIDLDLFGKSTCFSDIQKLLNH